MSRHHRPWWCDGQALAQRCGRVCETCPSGAFCAVRDGGFMDVVHTHIYVDIIAYYIIPYYSISYHILFICT